MSIRFNALNIINILKQSSIDYTVICVIKYYSEIVGFACYDTNFNSIESFNNFVSVTCLLL